MTRRTLPHASPSRAGAALAALTLLLVAAPVAADTNLTATAVSPGASERAVAIAGRCPTFSWAPVPGASGHELVVFELAGAPGAEPRLVLRRELPATASWTPPLDDALEPGRAYAWSVRGVGKEEGEWSAPLLFTVALAPSEEEVRAALDVLERAAAALPAPSTSEASGAAPQATPARDRRDAARSPVPAPADAPALVRELFAELSPELSPATAISAIRGETPGATGELVGVTGVSASPDGAGLYGVNQATTSPGVGVWGTSAATAGRGVFGEATATSGFGAGVYGTSASTFGSGVMGFATASTGAVSGLLGATLSLEGQGVYGSAPRRGVYGLASDSGEGYGVVGWYTGGGLTGAGVYGRAGGEVGSAAGVRGETLANAGAGVVGEALAACCANMGVFGKSISTDGIGVLGRTTSIDGGIGVQGISDAAAGIGVRGDGDGIGVQGEGDRIGVLGSGTYSEGVVGESSYGDGVRGHAVLGSDSYGVLGESDQNIGVRGTGPQGGVSGESPSGHGVSGTSTDGAGVYGTSTNGDGLFGEAHAPAKSGVFATSSHPDGWAAFFTGRVHVNGTLSKLAGSFTIDHPLDPLEKTLSHSFVESPDMKNFYDGVVTLDGSGEAWVELPEWFEALNGELRYQLTPIGAWSRAWIGEPVHDKRFLVRGEPGAVLSWQVTGVRQDVWARRHRIPVEAEKPAWERGKSLHPAEWEGILDVGAANAESGPEED